MLSLSWSPRCLWLYKFVLQPSVDRGGWVLTSLLLQRHQFFQLLLLCRVEVLQPLAEQRQLPLVLLLLAQQWHFMIFPSKSSAWKVMGMLPILFLLPLCFISFVTLRTHGYISLHIKSWPILCCSCCPKKDCCCFCVVRCICADIPRCEATLYLHLLPINLCQLWTLPTSPKLSFQFGFSCYQACYKCTAWHPLFGFPSPDFQHICRIIGRGEIWLAWQKRCLFYKVGKWRLAATTDWCQPIRGPK